MSRISQSNNKNPKDIEGLTPEQIQAKFALPETPTNIVDVVVSEGTGITEGEVGPNFGFDPPEGTMQYELRTKLGTDNFTNSRILPDIIPVTPVAPQTVISETVVPEPIMPETVIPETFVPEPIIPEILIP